MMAIQERVIRGVPRNQDRPSPAASAKAWCQRHGISLCQGELRTPMTAWPSLQLIGNSEPWSSVLPRRHGSHELTASVGLII
jgi:hypothetical protein